MAKGRRVGYARETPKSCPLETQIDKLSDCDIIFQENISDNNVEEKTELKKTLEYVHRGDLLVIAQLRCIFINVENFSDVAAILRDKGVDLIILELELDNDYLNTIPGRYFYHILSRLGVFKPGRTKYWST